MEGGKKSVFASFFVRPEDREFVGGGGGGDAFWGILQHQQQAIACCQTHSDYGPPKMPLKLVVQNSQIRCHHLPL